LDPVADFRSWRTIQKCISQNLDAPGTIRIGEQFAYGRAGGITTRWGVLESADERGGSCVW